MSKSFTFWDEPQHRLGRKLRVAVTGAAGRIGSFFVAHSGDRYELTLIDHPKVTMPPEVARAGRMKPADLADLEGLKKAFGDADVVLHLAAVPSPTATWDDLHRNNIVGTYNAMVAAKAAGCGKIVFASSIHAVSGYPQGFQVHPEDAVNPGDLYGVTKCFGEAMGRYMSEQHDMSVIVVRITGFKPLEKALEQDSYRIMNAFVSRRDLAHLFDCAIDDVRLRFAVVHGESMNRFNRLNIALTRELLGYRPQDDLTQVNPELEALDLDESVTPHDERASGKSGIRDDL